MAPIARIITLGRSMRRTNAGPPAPKKVKININIMTMDLMKRWGRDPIKSLNTWVGSVIMPLERQLIVMKLTATSTLSPIFSATRFDRVELL